MSNLNVRKLSYEALDPIKPSSLLFIYAGQIGENWLIWDNEYWYKWYGMLAFPNAPSIS